MAKKFYITTAIDYVNAEPHIGHAYQKIIADTLARYHKLKGEQVFLLTGTDEHGQKIARSAEQAKLPPKEFCDKMSIKFKRAWQTLDIEYDRFIRTTDPDHEAFVQEFIKKINDSGDIYKGEYEGLYCVDCETFYTEKDIVNGCCPVHKKPLETLKEDTYFFKLAKYQSQLLEHYKKYPKFIMPESRKHEIINRVKEGLKDLSITRTNITWGIPFPLNSSHVVYVWFDALLNYLTGAGNKQEFWPAQAHLLGKDNGWFHAVIWPAMLLSAGYKLPETVFIHGFLKVNGEKISKSLGNAISPLTLAEKYGADSVRYFVARQIPFGEDGDFSEKALVERHNNELANKLGNLISRVTTLAEKYGIEKCKNKLLDKLRFEEIKELIENYELDKALGLIFEFIDACNEYIQHEKPWEASYTNKGQTLYELINSIKAVSYLLWPFMPETCEKIAKTLGYKIESLKDFSKPVEGKIKKSDILFQKI
jgi:methionyl-tRNA synthetase